MSRRWFVPHSTGCVALRVQVNHKRLVGGFCHSASKIDGSRRFSDATFLICDAKNASHGIPLRKV
jgi:hypothetical protein